MTDVSVIVNLHGEGRIAVAALRSAAAAITAAPGLSCEILAVVDRGDEATERALRRFEGPLRQENCDFGDPALARNFGVERAKGRFVAFLDGDDLMGESWLRRAAQALHTREGRDVVAHPRLNYVFGRDAAPIVWMHPDMERDPIDLSLLRAGNFWTSASFAAAALHRRFPFRANALEAGLGHEDWAFHLATVEAGATHIAPEDTVHFIRRGQGDGRLAQSQARRVLPNFGGLAEGLG
jgi:glycosyltransferase involved in cell wall biosynthesis